MIEMMLGAMVLALWVKVGAAAAADAITTLRASKAGEWGLIDKQRDRKAAQSKSRRDAVSKAWQATRAARNKKAGGTGRYRPGMAAYLGDVYHGVWEDQLEKRKAKRANRPAVGPDGKRSTPSRMDRAVEAQVGKHRTKTGYLGRAARLLIDPVGEKRQPADVVAPRSGGRGDDGSVGAPVDPWPFDGDEPTVEIAADGPRTACPVCGATLTTVNGGWQHPDGSTCALGYPLDPEDGKSPNPGNGSSVVHDNDQPATDAPAREHTRSDTAEPKTSTTNKSSNGGTAMTDNTDLLDYTTAVAEHEQVLAKLREQRAEATAFKQHITGATTAVEHMDGNRDVLATGLSAIAEGMEGSRFGADATSGSAEAAGALSAGSIAAVQEHIEAANDTNDRWITELDASIEGVQASLQHLKSTYGEAAATVQETGVDARALAEH